jgi:hypothetical protein
MAKKTDSFEAYEEKIASVKLDRYSRANLHLSTHVESLNDVIAEGNRLIAEEEMEKKNLLSAIKDDPKKPDLNLKNPYARAKAEVFKKLPPKAKETIEKMEAGKIPKDKRYDIFVKEIITLGDKYSGE